MAGYSVLCAGRAEQVIRTGFGKGAKEVTEQERIEKLLEYLVVLGNAESRGDFDFRCFLESTRKVVVQELNGLLGIKVEKE